MIIGITGHRMEELDEVEASDWVGEALGTVFSIFQPSKVVQGCAHGADLMSAAVAYYLSIPYVAVRPWLNHSVPEKWADEYESMLLDASEVVVTSAKENYSGPNMYGVRNEYIVDNCDHLVAVWSGRKSGGTWYTVKYARKAGIPITIIDPVTRTITYGVDLDTLFWVGI